MAQFCFYPLKQLKYMLANMEYKEFAFKFLIKLTQ